MNTDNDTREGARAVLLMTVGRIARQALTMLAGLALLVATLQGYVLPNWSVLPLLLGYAAYVLLGGLIRTNEIQRISLGLGLSG